MGCCHSHNVLCGGTFIKNIVERVEVVAMGETTKEKVGSEHNRILLLSIPQEIRMDPNR